MSSDKWYADGLSFSCTQCGNCCSGPPGHVWVTQRDIQRIAEYLDKPDGTLDSTYIRRVGLRQSLTEKPGGDCVFLVRTGGKALCAIHPVKPLQCRTWPFWTENLRTQTAWDAAGQMCPGMNHGPRYDFVAIEELRSAKPE